MLVLPDATVDISLWSTIEVGVSVFAANLATLRPLIHHFTTGDRSWSIRTNKRERNMAFKCPELQTIEEHVDHKE
jgi:hypothetical protein